MGLFSSRYETTVGTVVSRVIDDASVPNATKSGSIKSLFNDGNFPDYVMEELAVSMGVRAERMYTYAEDHYVHGLPSGEVYSSNQGRLQAEAVIEAAEGQQVLMKYVRFGPPNALHIGWLKLVNQYGYNEANNQIATLTTAKGTPVYLKDMVVVVPQNQLGDFEVGVLDQWGTSPSSGYTPERTFSTGFLSEMSGSAGVYKSASASQISIKVTYVWETNTNVPLNGAAVPVTYNKVLNEESITLTIEEYDPAADYFHAKYVKGSQTKYWMYKYGTGTYPTLDAVFVGAPAVSGSYFPFAYFRYNKQSVISDKTTDAYKTSKKLVKYLGIDYDLVAESINDNPDIADVEQAMMIMAVPAVSTNPIECRYLFDYFDTLHYDMDGGGSYQTEQAFAALSDEPIADNVIVIQDAQFKMTLSNKGIYKRLVAGALAGGATHTSSYGTATFQTEVTDLATGTISTFPSSVTEHRYCKQVAPGLYEEILVRGLRMNYFVFEGYNTTADENDSILLIPIDRTISQNYSVGDRETLYCRSLHFVFNSRVITKIKWYQTGLFQVIVIIIAIVITAYTYGADGGSLIATALGLSGTAGLIATIVVNLVIGKLLAAGFTLFVKAFGTELATAIAVLAIVYGGYQVVQAGSVSGAPFAMELLQIANGLQQAVLSVKFDDLLAESQTFQLFVEEQTKTLDTVKELLENSTFLNPFVIFGETPGDFYNRTVHSGNIGVLGINAISSYVDVALTLPKLNDTLGEELNGNQP